MNYTVQRWDKARIKITRYEGGNTHIDSIPRAAAVQLRDQLTAALADDDPEEAIDRFSVEKQIAYLYDALKRTNVRVTKLEQEQEQEQE